MEFRAVFIANPARLSVRREQLVIRQDREVTVPMEDISSLMLESQAVTISSAALQKLADHGVTVYFCDEKHLPAALLLPINRHSRQLKALKGQIAMTKPAQKRLWQSVVTAKICNQARCLELMDRPGSGDLMELARSVRSGDPDNCEAAAAARYFPALFGTGFTREAGCLTNGALNYGYAILRGAVARNLAVHGIEPCLGIFHHSELNQFNLADDLMEPYRPLVDLYTASSCTGGEQGGADARDEAAAVQSHQLPGAAKRKEVPDDLRRGTHDGELRPGVDAGGGEAGAAGADPPGALPL